MSCPRCRKQNADHDNFCVQCGQPLHHATSPHFGYAGFWRRFAAYMIDQFILLIPMIVAGLIIGFLSGMVGGGSLGATALGNILGLLISWLYWAIMESSSKQATYGKRLMKIKVTDTHGQTISFGRASGRFFGKFLSTILLMLGWLMAAFTAKKQGLHDLMAGCVVVREDNKGMPGVGIAVLVLVAFIPLGMMAAVAIPAYQDRIVRTKVASSMTLVNNMKDSITEFYDQNGSWPVLGADFLGPTTNEFVSNMTLTSSDATATLVATLRPDKINKNLAGKTIQLQTTDGGITWKCSGTIPNYISSCR